MMANGVESKNNKPQGVEHEDWIYMINNVWTNKDFKARSQKAKVAHAALPYNHACGSKSFQATMFSMAIKNDGQTPHIMDLYRETHWSKPKNNWVHPTCKEVHEEFGKVRDRCSQPNASPMSQDKISIEVLGARSGYLRGLRVGPKPSSSRNSVHSLARDEELNRLREKVTTLEGQNQ